MTRRSIVALSVTACAAAFVTPTLAGPQWIEGSAGLLPDAGSVPSSAQGPFDALGSPGSPTPLAGITGSLFVNPDGVSGDLEDMYKIRIRNPLAFRASTFVDGAPADTTFDSEIFLFRADGRGLLANDDAMIGERGSSIAQPATDGTGQTIPGPGLYFVAVAFRARVPVNAVGDPLFSPSSPTEVSGPDGPGGAFPIDSWIGAPQGRGFTEPGQYQYTIHFEGAFFPTPGAASLFIAAGVGAMRRRR